MLTNHQPSFFPFLIQNLVRVLGLEDMHVLDVACGRHHTLALAIPRSRATERTLRHFGVSSAEHEVYAWGKVGCFFVFVFVCVL